VHVLHLFIFFYYDVTNGAEKKTQLDRLMFYVNMSHHLGISTYPGQPAAYNHP